MTAIPNVVIINIYSPALPHVTPALAMFNIFLRLFSQMV